MEIQASSGINGLLGDGTTNSRLIPWQIGTGFAAVAAGLNHSLAMKTDGSVWAWGTNSAGQLGDGTTTDRLSPVQVTFAPPPPAVSLSSLAISCPSSLNEGTSGTCTASASYSNGSSTSVTPTWSSFNTSVATVNSSGTVTAGQVSDNNYVSITISASYTEGGVTKTASMSVIVNDVATVPATPTNVTATAGNGSISVTFREQTRAGIAPPRYSFTVNCVSTSGGAVVSATGLGYDFGVPPAVGIAIGQSSITVPGPLSANIRETPTFLEISVEGGGDDHGTERQNGRTTGSGRGGNAGSP